MVFFNHATRQMTAKIVYYGPGLCGKTTNLNTIYAKTAQKARGEMVSLNTETDRTLFFDLLPMDVGVIGGFKAKLQLYTVPGQVFYNSTRKLVLKGVDGIVFVVDSQTAMLDASRESLQNLESNLKELGMSLQNIPLVFQWNKRDLRSVVPVEELERELNPLGVPSFSSIANDGTGVFETLRGITKLSLVHIRQHHFGESEAKPVPLSRDELAAELPTGPSVPVSAPPVLPAAPLKPVPRPSPVVARTLPVPPMVVPVARPILSAAPKLLKPASSRMGELALPGLTVSPSTLKVRLDPGLDASELEVVVEIRQHGRTVGEGRLLKAAPSQGAPLRLSLELKRD